MDGELESSSVASYYNKNPSILTMWDIKLPQQHQGGDSPLSLCKLVILSF
jgi:hypothetical protein